MTASKITYQNLSDYNQFLFKKEFKVNKIIYFASEKMRNSGNYIYDYTQSHSSERISNPLRYTCH